MQLSILTNQVVHQNLKSLCRSERAITAEILTYIAEVYRRKIHLQMGYGSLLSYLMKEMGYSKSAALRRMDGANILVEIPELKQDFEDGTLNLTQVSMFAQGVRQKAAEQKRLSEKPSIPNQADLFSQPETNQPKPPSKAIFSAEEKKEVLNKLKNQTVEQTQKTLAQEFDLKVQAQEKKRHQRDKSVRVEMTFTEEQFKELERAKELLSHVHSGGKLSDIMAYAISELLKRKDPVRKAAKKNARQAAQAKSSQSKCNQGDSIQATADQHANFDQSSPSEVARRHEKPRSVTDLTPKPPIKPKASRRYSAVTKRTVLAKAQECQWCDPKTGQRCGSKFQVQIDHIQPIWAGGSDDPENLQVLCAAHNRFKYQQESRTKSRMRDVFAVSELGPLRT